MFCRAMSFYYFFFIYHVLFYLHGWSGPPVLFYILYNAYGAFSIESMLSVAFHTWSKNGEGWVPLCCASVPGRWSVDLRYAQRRAGRWSLLSLTIVNTESESLCRVWNMNWSTGTVFPDSGVNFGTMVTGLRGLQLNVLVDYENDFVMKPILDFHLL